MLFRIAILVLLILISGVLSSLEIALSSSNPNRVKLRAEAGDKGAARLLSVMDEPGSFFATTQFYITFIAFFSGAFAANSFTEPLVRFALQAGLPLRDYVAESLAFVLITALLTYVALVFGELVPKRIAMRYAIPFSIRALPFLHALSILALPIVKLLSASANLVLRLVGFKDDGLAEDVTKEEIRLMVESGSEHGHIAETEQGMIENIFAFDQMTAADICTHRLDVVALPLDADFNTVIEVLTSENYTRVPVYEESLDNIRGILHLKDVMHYMANQPGSSGFHLQSLLRKAHFVPLSKRADELFQEMRKNRTYMAVVIDEHGGTMGIVTMEDLVEEIVGSIQDEYDTDEQPDISPIDENSFRIQGTTDLESVQDLFGLPLPLDEYDTLSGFLVGLLGHIPNPEERPEIPFHGLLFKVERVQEKRIATVVATVCKTKE